jgi:hypothetical protein
VCSFDVLGQNVGVQLDAVVLQTVTVGGGEHEKVSMAGAVADDNTYRAHQHARPQTMSIFQRMFRNLGESVAGSFLVSGFFNPIYAQRVAMEGLRSTGTDSIIEGRFGAKKFGY